MYKCAVIGLGRIGKEFPDNHTKAYIDHPEVNLVAVYDKNPDKKFNLPHVDSIAQIDADIISVCTPPETHREVVEQIKPRAIYLEKPIATTLEDADAIIKYCKENKILLQVNHQRRFGYAKFRFARGILNTGTHVFDLLRQYFGEVTYLDGEVVHCGDKVCELEYIDSDEFIFELTFHGSISQGIQEIIDCLETGRESVSNGYEARRDLELCLQFQSNSFEER